MSPEEYDRACEIFSAAKDLGALERPAFLEAQCAGDAQLCAAVQALLDGHEQASRDDFLNAPLVRIDFGLTTDNRSAESLGRAADAGLADRCPIL